MEYLSWRARSNRNYKHTHQTHCIQPQHKPVKHPAFLPLLVAGVPQFGASCGARCQIRAGELPAASQPGCCRDAGETHRSGGCSFSDGPQTPRWSALKCPELVKQLEKMVVVSPLLVHSTPRTKAPHVVHGLQFGLWGHRKMSHRTPEVNACPSH